MAEDYKLSDIAIVENSVAAENFYNSLFLRTAANLGDYDNIKARIKSQIYQKGGFIRFEKHLHTVKGEIDAVINPRDFERVVLISNLDVNTPDYYFACHENGKIHIYKGQLNSGLYLKKPHQWKQR